MFKSMTIEEILQLPYVDKLDDINTLTMVYNPVTDEIILNSNAENFEICTILVTSYLNASTDKREELKTKIKSFSEETSLLDKIIRIRHEKEVSTPEGLRKQYITEFKMINSVKAFWDHLDFICDIPKITEYPELATADAFNWGYIQGKRAERARRKKVVQ